MRRIVKLAETLGKETENLCVIAELELVIVIKLLWLYCCWVSQEVCVTEKF